MVGKFLQPEIRDLIESRNFVKLREAFQDWSPADLAEVIADLPEAEQVVLFRVLPHQLAADVFEYLNVDAQQHLLHAMGHEQAVKILNEMSPDDRTALLEELPSTAVTQLLRLLTPEERVVAQELLGYPENTVGRLMTPDFIAVRDDWTVQQVLDHVREHGQDSETLNVIYIVDDRDKLLGDVRIREFLLRPLDAKIMDFRERSFIALKVTDPKEEAVNQFRKYDRSILPVVDSEGVLVGIVTIDDVLDVVEAATTEDIQKLGGVEALDKPYLIIDLWSMIKKRAHWLVILFLGEMLTATAMVSFQNEIEKFVILALFVPLIISSGGNSGSQAATLIIRAMALGEVKLSEWWKVMRREVISGFSLGTILGTIGFSRVAIWHFLFKVYPHWPFGDYGPHWFLLALTVGLSLIGVVLWGTLSGSMLPFILRRFGADPANSSAPLVATLVDVTGLIIYFSVAAFIFRGLLI